MIDGNTERRKSTCSEEDSRPREKRTKELARFLGFPREETTWEGASEPAEQAEPLEAQSPSISRAASSAILSEWSTTKETVFERRFARDPTNRTPSRLSISLRIRSTSGI